MENFLDIYTKLGVVALPLILCAVLCVFITISKILYYIKSADYKFIFDLKSEEEQELEITQLAIGYNKNVRVLKIIAVISPLLGLLGTVLGIIKAFQEIADSTKAVAPNLIADGIWEAMLTTAAGLFIAIPTLLLAHAFSAYSERLIADITYQVNKQNLK